MTSVSSLSGCVALVTGGCGFIGAHLVRALVQAGTARVVVLDRLRHGDPRGVADSGPTVEVRPFALGTDPPDALPGLLHGIDYVFHLAADKHRVAETSPREVLATNVTGTLDLLRAAGEARVRRVVYASSVFAYGRCQAPALDEAETPRPDTVYGASKLAGEHLLRDLRRTAGVPSVALRYFFVYGPGQEAGLGYPSVIVKNFERLSRGEGPTVVGDGRQVLDYVYVDDVIEATLLAAQSKDEDGLYNVGSGQPTAIHELLTRMSEAAGSEAAKTPLPPDETAGTWRVARVEKAGTGLGWSPRTPLREGLARTWAWMSERP